MLEQYLRANALRGIIVATCLSLLVGCSPDTADAAASEPDPDPAAPNSPAPISIPQAPGNLTVVAGVAMAKLNWSASANAQNYLVKRSTTSGGPYAQIGSTASLSYSDSTATAGTTYYYVVSAVNSAGESAASAQVAATPSAPPAPVAAPSDVSASAGNAKVMLSWSASNGATRYNVKRATTEGGPYSQVGTPIATTFTDSSVSNEMKYYYVVSAVSPSGESANSAEISATPVAPPPVVVGKCDSLAAPGQWQEISPAGMNKAPPFDGALYILVDPTRGGTLYVTTSRSGIFKSNDCGASWTKVNTGRNGDKIDQGLIWSAEIDPVNPQTIYVLTGYGPNGLWKSTNGGVDWDNVLPTNMGMPGFVARVGMNPNDPQHLLVNFHENCTGGHTPVCFGETKDGGKTWRVVDFPTSIKSGWGEGSFILPIDATHWLYEFWELYYTADAGKTWKRVDPGVAAVQGPYHRTNDGAFWLASQNGVITSPDGENWSKVPNSGGWLDGVTACGNSLYSVVGFFAPGPNEPFIYSAPLSNPMNWSPLPTPGLPSSMPSGANSIACDKHHGVLYVAAQGAGLLRMSTGIRTGN